MWTVYQDELFCLHVKSGGQQQQLDGPLDKRVWMSDKLDLFLFVKPNFNLRVRRGHFFSPCILSVSPTFCLQSERTPELCRWSRHSGITSAQLNPLQEVSQALINRSCLLFRCSPGRPVRNELIQYLRWTRTLFSPFKKLYQLFFHCFSIILNKNTLEMQKQKYNSDIELMEFEGWLFHLSILCLWYIIILWAWIQMSDYPQCWHSSSAKYLTWP